MAACKERHTAVVTALLAAGADVGRAGRGGWTPLHQACVVRGNAPVISALLNAPGVAVDTPNDDGNTALHYWCRAYSAQDTPSHLLVCRFVALGADVNARNREGETPLFVACWRNNVTTVAWLLDHGANPALSNLQGVSCLHAAAMMGYDAVLAWLLAHPRCDDLVGLRDVAGKTALDVLKPGCRQQAALESATQHWLRRDELRQWLTAAGVDQKYHSRFEVEEFDLTTLRLVTDEVLQAMKLPAAVRLTVMHALRKGTGSSGPSAVAVSSSTTTTDVEDDACSLSVDDADVAAQLAANRVPLLPPEQLLLRHVVGTGFFSEVRLAQWNGVLVAVKSITDQPNRYHSKTHREMFLQEVAIMARLRHPHIVQLLGVTVGAGSLSIVTEYMGGGTLYGLVRSPRWEPKECRRYFVASCQIAKGMTYLHSTNTLHRDLTSRNVLLDAEQNAKIADFGVSRLNSPDYITPHPVGALPYVAPEVYLYHRYSEASDVYSFAIILGEMLTGLDPNAGMRPKEMADAVATRHFRPALPEHCTPALAAVIASAWHENPAVRPSFLSLMDSLDALGTEEGDDGYVDRFGLM